MGIIQEKRFNASQPEVKDTDYGARYVKAATETPVSEIPPAKEKEVKVEPIPVAKEGDVVTEELHDEVAVPQQHTEQVEQKNDAEAHPNYKPRKKSGRPKKNRK